MLELTIKAQECFDELSNEFITTPEVHLQLEHSLYSLSKWEAKHKKPYMSSLEKHRKTEEEVIDYFRCMSLTEVGPEVFNSLTTEHIKAIGDYQGIKRRFEIVGVKNDVTVIDDFGHGDASALCSQRDPY